SMAVARYAIGKNHAIFIDDPSLDERFADKSRSIISGVIKSVVCVPLSKKSMCLGAIYLDSNEQKKNFNDADRDFVIKLASHISELLEMSGLFHELVSEYEGIEEILSKVSKKSELEDLLKKIVMADVKTKISAIEKVAATNNESIVEILKENLSNEENRFLIATYVKILGAIAGEGEIDLVKKYLLHPDARVRANAIGALLNMNARERALDKIVKMTADEDSKVKTLASHYVLSLNHNLLINEFEKLITSARDTATIDGVINSSFLLGLGELEKFYAKVYPALGVQHKTMVADYLKSLDDEKASFILQNLEKISAESGARESKQPVPQAVPSAPAKSQAAVKIATAASVNAVKQEINEKVNPANNSYEADENVDDDIMSEFQSALKRVNAGAKAESNIKSIMYQLKLGKKK
ncbi:MAG TPA: hypothetical protein PK467_12955, partial [Candidatus Wallbacteria bacterium]|nr:hypothetical protein [Candidatus Wallbacteria bacterium]